MTAPPTLPLPFDDEKCRLAFDRWREEATRRESAFMQEATEPDSPHYQLLAALFGNSPYLTHCALRDPTFMERVLLQGPAVAWAVAEADMRASLPPTASEPALMKGLRVAKRQMALATAVADITGEWPLRSITETLSGFAETALRLTLAVLLRAAHETGHIALPDPEHPERACGYTLFAMGKMGARELNYSSDIDLIALYDPEIVTYTGTKSVSELFVRLTKNVVRIMEERTADGYVFRTDLRLRPDPGSTALALSVQAAMAYYESLGQNWERAAMIKIRSVAGDGVLGARFIKEMRPFVWRRSLDFYAIRDIHSIKRQINAVKGWGVVQVAGHNIKLGRGGIREIEFFAQTQQLIFGGREPVVRAPATLDALAALTASGRVSEAVRDDLIECYHFLRTLEHRLQMIDDAQTQTLPSDPHRLAALAVFMGFANVDDFEAKTRTILNRVEVCYADLFEEEDSLSEDGNLVFTGSEDDPGTLATLAEMGFANPSVVIATVRGWHHGRYRALRATRARELLTELIPTLLQAFSRTRNPDRAFTGFDGFLSRLPMGVQIFALFVSNPSLLDLVAEIMGDAPRLATLLSTRPGTLDAVLAPGFFDLPPMGNAGRALLTKEIDALLSGSRHYEETLDMLRLWANGRKFQIGVQTLQGLLTAGSGGQALAAVADVTVAKVLEATEAEFAVRHGSVAGGGMAILALGTAAAEEMISSSDLDLVMVYEATGETSDGVKPLAASEWFGRLTQRVVAGITALTSEGRLYDVDLRLRPEGTKGPLASSLEAIRRYYDGAAWTWEFLALTRARVIAGPPELVSALEATIADVFARPRDPDQTLVDIADMRRLMVREHKPSGPFDVKLRRGGLIDIEFIVGTLVLITVAHHPEVRSAKMEEAVARLADIGVLAANDAEILAEAHGLWLEIRSVLRHLMDEPFNPDDPPAGVVSRLTRATGEPDLATLTARMEATATAVLALYERLIDSPADLARTRLEAKPLDPKPSEISRDSA